MLCSFEKKLSCISDAEARLFGQLSCRLLFMQMVPWEQADESVSGRDGDANVPFTCLGVLCCKKRNKLSCTLLTYLFLFESSMSALENNCSFKVRKESPACLFLSLRKLDSTVWIAISLRMERGRKEVRLERVMWTEKQEGEQTKSECQENVSLCRLVALND